MIRHSASTIAVLTALCCSVAMPVYAQSGSPTSQSDTGDDIIVTADPAMVEALRGISPERSYDAEAVSSYGISTVGELVDEIRAENGDEEPVFLINGEPVTDIDDVADYPAEAVERLEVLPRGSGQLVGRAPDRRVYNVVLKNQVRSVTLTASREVATEGEWGETTGEAIGSRIAGRDRLNLTLRVRDSDALTEADRDILQPGFPSTLFQPGYLDPVDRGLFRTLRPDARTYEASLIGSNRLTSWLSATYSLRGRKGRDDSLSGLPAGLFLLPGSSAFSPGGSDLLVGLYGPDPLEQRSKRRTLSGNLAFNATRGDWLATLTGQFDINRREFSSDRQDFALLSQPVVLTGLRNPFIDPLTDLFVIATDLSEARESSHSLRLQLGGPVLALPAGPLRVRLAAERRGNRLRAIRTGGQASERTYERNETDFEAGLDLPLASRRNGFLPELGELNLSLDHAVSAVDHLPDIERSSAALLWQPVDEISVTATLRRAEELPYAESLADPIVVYDNVRTYDFLTGETVDVSVISGGNPALRPITTTSRKLSLSVAPWPRYNLQLNADYESTTARNFVSSVPAASADVFRAFPERFLRDASGRLVTVDSRPANFDRQSREEIRYGLSFFVPLGGNTAAGASAPTAGPVGSRPRLQVVASHAIALHDEVTIRAGLPVVDVLNGGAVGIAGGRPRHLLNGSVSLTDRGTGLRLSGQYRSVSILRTGSTAAPDTLRFAPIFTATVQAFADLGPLLPDTVWLKDTRVSLTVKNLANERQGVTDTRGLIPLRYQSAYRDPVGRTVEIELRKVF